MKTMMKYLCKAENHTVKCNEAKNLEKQQCYYLRPEKFNKK